MWMVTVSKVLDDFGEWPVDGAEEKNGASVVYFSSRTVARAFAGAYRGKLAKAVWEIDLAYQETWTAKAVGTRWWLRPAWDNSAVPHGRIALEMKTGLVFGGGDHDTTCASLEMLELASCAGARIFDLGTGTGILSDAARALGAKTVAACDLEADAARMARERGMDCFQGPSFAARGQSFDVVMANIPGYVHLDLASEYKRLLIRGGELVLSGYYEWQVEKIDAAVGDDFVKLRQIMRGDGWIGALYRRSKASAAAPAPSSERI